MSRWLQPVREPIAGERRYGSFSRSFSLPQGTDESKVRARIENGVLEVTVEGAAVLTEPKRIQIEGFGR